MIPTTCSRLQRRRSHQALLLIASTVAIASCAQPRRLPTTPSTPAPTVPVASSAPGQTVETGPPLAPGPPSFSLSVSSFTVQLFRHNDSPILQYVPAKLEIVETGGMSRAQLRTLDVDVPGGERDRDCSDSQMVRNEVIAPGGRRDFTVTMGYCIPYADARAEVSEVTFVATFSDDDGRLGAVTGKADVSGCTLNGAAGLVLCR